MLLSGMKNRIIIFYKIIKYKPWKGSDSSPHYFLIDGSDSLCLNICSEGFCHFLRQSVSLLNSSIRALFLIFSQNLCPFNLNSSSLFLLETTLNCLLCWKNNRKGKTCFLCRNTTPTILQIRDSTNQPSCSTSCSTHSHRKFLWMCPPNLFFYTFNPLAPVLLSKAKENTTSSSRRQFLNSTVV